MKIEFQDDLIKFLFQNKDAKKYIRVLEPDIFDLDSHQTAFTLLKGFIQSYNSQPSLGNVLEYFDREIKSKQFKGEDLSNVYAEIENTLRECYVISKANTDQIREIIIEEFQLKLLRQMFTEKASEIKSGNSQIVIDIFRAVKKIKDVAENDLDEEDNRGQFALSQFKKGQKTLVEGKPTYLKALNGMTSTGGFYAPQLVIFLAPPKGFKTGSMLNLAVNYVRDGEQVYYVDCENGEDRLLDRFYQCMLEATWKEYSSGELDDTLEEMVKKFMVMGGDFRADFYPAHTKSMADVEDNLAYLEEEFNWKPSMIIYDYLDLLRPEDHTIKEKRLMIQACYFDSIRLHKRHDIFGLGLSQVSAGAVNKAEIRMTDFAEDFGKAANCHAAFAICGTEAEERAGVRRIIPVAQRDGVGPSSKVACFVEIDAAKMSLKEITKEEWATRVEAEESTLVVKKKYNHNKKNLADE